MAETNNVDNQVYSTGAVRSGKKPNYRDVPTSLLRRIANAFTEGREKYEKNLPPYEKNWESGDLVFALDAIDHAFEHLLLYRDQVRDQLLGLPVADQEDHLGHLGANLAMLAQFEEWGYWLPEEEEAEELPEEGLAEAVEEPTDVATETDDSVVRKILSTFGF